jgi:hypothetical protein
MDKIPPRFKKVQKPLRIHFIMPPISLEERYGKLKDMGTLYPSITFASELRTALLAKGVTHVVLVRHHTTDGATYISFENYYNTHITIFGLH